MKKLTGGQKHILKLIEKKNGYAYVSNFLYYPLLREMPKRLVKFKIVMGQGYAELTEEGKSVLNTMKWL